MATFSPPPNANPAALSLYAKLQKLSEDIQLQHSIITAQKETVLKSRQRAYDPQKIEPTSDQTHLVHTHAGTVLQHRAMLIKHYGLIQQHKQMVKEQGIHVQNLTSTLHNIQQETTMVDELMNTKMAESKSNVITSTSSPSSSSSLSLQGDAKATRTSSTHTKRKSNHQTIDNIIIPEHHPSSPDIRSTPLPTDVVITNTNLDALEGENKEITITSTTSTTTTTQTSTTTETTTISSTSTPSSTTTTSTTTTTTTTNPSDDSLCDSDSSSSSSESSCDSPMFDSPAFDPPSCGSPCAPFSVDEIPLPLSP